MADDSLATTAASPRPNSGPVTEFSRLSIKDGLSDADKEVIPRVLAHAKKLMEDFTCRSFFIFEGIEQPGHIFILGEWASVEQHMKEWIPSPQNQGLLKDLEHLVNVDWLFHLDIAFGSLPISRQVLGTGQELFAERTDGDAIRPIVFSCGIQVMDTSKRPGFETTFNKGKPCLEAHTLGHVSSGWRVDADAGREEFVLFSPWKTVSEHMAFGKTSDFQEYVKIREFIRVDASEVFHMSIKELPLGK
ncbi:hypothetical protein N0V90_006801 [Kalmusia sp. IMI 367209]|nr:hypothetical protein N0V90_006801 [Kalmusia sp. IMI 367209]